MTPAKPDDVLGQIAVALKRSDPRLADRLTGQVHRRRQSQELASALVALAALVGGLPLILASPFWGCMLCVSGFVALTGITFAMTQHYPCSRWLSTRRRLRWRGSAPQR